MTPKWCSLRYNIPLQVLGAGKTDGAMDAANLLKPMLARGELRCIGATTLAEYRQHMEKDAAFERRFQQVREKSKRHLARDNTMLCPAEAKRLHFTLLESTSTALAHLRPAGPSCKDDDRQIITRDQKALAGWHIARLGTMSSGWRVQVIVNEPSVLDTIQILRGIAEKYASFHGVRISDRALVAAAELSTRYIQGRFCKSRCLTPCKDP